MVTPFRSRRTSRSLQADRALAGRRPPLRLESLEGRLCPSSGSLVVGSFGNNSVLRYDESTGAVVDQFDPPGRADLKTPVGGVFGPDHNLYVSSNIFSKNNQEVLQYNGTTGAFQCVFASQNITSPRGLLFGPDGNLYVLNGNDDASGDPASVERFDGKTGAFLGNFVAPSSGGLTHPSYMVFGPDGKNDGKLDLYVAVAAEREGSSPHSGEILRYDGTTGAFLGTFVAPGSGGLNAPQGMLFGSDGSLYVASGNWFASPEVFYTGNFPAGAVLRFEGPSGPNPGAFLGTFVAGGSGGLANPCGMVFGPDPSGNGTADLYVASSQLDDFKAVQGTSEVLRYDATTGAYLGTFVAPGNGLKFASFITFTETDPTTLNYNGGQKLLTAASPATLAATQSLQQTQVTPLLGEAIHRWQTAGVDTSALHGIDLRIANLGGATLGLASGHTITLDDNAAGWGWFVDNTPSNDSEFLTPGNQGEKNRMDLLTVLEHEVGHLLGYEHEATGIMTDTLPAGIRRTPSGALTGAEVSPWLGGIDNKKDSFLAVWLGNTEVESN